MNEFEKILACPVSRRTFLSRMSAAGLGSAAMTLLSGCGSGGGNGNGAAVAARANFPGIPGRSIDEVVLNYALTLEILEADLYRQALNLASGRALNTPLDATPPPSGSTGGYTQAVGNGSIAGNLALPAFLYLVQYAYVEAAHRDFLRVVLQSIGAPVAQANAKGYTAPFGTTLSSIMDLLYAVEEEGTRAYLGAAGFIQNVTYLTTAVAIYSTECRHASAVAYVLGKDPGPVFGAGDKRVSDGASAINAAPFSENTFNYYRDPKQVLSDVQPFIVS